MQTVTVIPAIETEKQVKKLRCAAYCRVSSDSTDQINSFNAQVRFYSEIFNNSDTEILADIYADEGITGTREDKRVQFQRMMKDCRRGKIDRIYTKSISRFSRNTKDCLKSVRELKELGISIFFEKENIDTSKMTDEMMITIMGGLAQEESVSISNNLRWSYLKRFEKGKVKPFSVPFGFTLENGSLNSDDEQSHIIKDIYTMYLSGKGYQQISDICRKKYSRYSNCFSYCGIRYILSNEKYIGDSIYQKTFMKKTFPYIKSKNDGVLPKYYITNTHSPIISKEIFQKVQQIIDEKRHIGSMGTYALSKKLICSSCNSTYKRKVRKTTVQWVCRNHDINANLCHHLPLNEQEIYKAFISLFNKLQANFKQILCPLANSLTELKLKKQGRNIRVMDIHKEIASLREQLHVIARLKTKGFLSDEKHLAQSKEIEAKISRCQNELAKISRADDDNDEASQLDMFISYLEKYEGEMVEFDEDIFTFMVDKILVMEDRKLEFHMIGGLKLTEVLEK